MEYSGGQNLFFSHFVMGGTESVRKFTQTDLDEIVALHEWMSFKDSDWGMEKYRTERTQYIIFPHEIDINALKEIFYDLIMIYKSSHPYSSKEDFIAHVFSFTIFDIEEFLKRDFYFLGNESGYDFYYSFLREDSEFIDVAIPTEFSLSHFKQYYKVVLKLIENLEYSSALGEINSVTTKETKNEFQSDSNDKQLPNKRKLTIRQIALLYVYNGDQITRQNCNSIIKKYGHNSGEKLFQEFTKYSSTANRKGRPTPFTLKRLNNKIKLIETVIDLLPPKMRTRAIDEVQILKDIKETEFE